MERRSTCHLANGIINDAAVKKWQLAHSYSCSYMAHATCHMPQASLLTKLPSSAASERFSENRIPAAAKRTNLAKVSTKTNISHTGVFGIRTTLSFIDYAHLNLRQHLEREAGVGTGAGTGVGVPRSRLHDDRDRGKNKRKVANNEIWLIIFFFHFNR